MKENKNTTDLKNIFKSIDDIEKKIAFNNIWIDLIRFVEKNKK